MSLANRAEPGRPWMPIEDFRAFQATRPDEEGWELIDGVPVMMMPTYVTHARIAGNIERLLSDALDIFDPSRIAIHEIGVDLGLSAETLPGLGRGAGYAPQPDVAVIDGACEAVLAVEQHRMEVRLSRRAGTAWRSDLLTKPDDAAVLPTCGLACRVADLYRGTPLARSLGLP